MAHLDQKISVRKMSDKEAVEKMKQIAIDIANEQSEAKVIIRSIGISETYESKVSGWHSPTIFDDIIGAHSEFITDITIFGNRINNAQLYTRWSRNKESPLVDTVVINSDGGGSVTLALAKPFMLAISKHFGDATSSSPPFRSLGPELDKFYSIREQQLLQKERHYDDFFTRLQQFTLDQTKENKRLQDELNDKYEKRIADQDAVYQSQLADIRRREDELAKQKSEFDTKESKGHRRSIHQIMKKDLQETIKGLELSPKALALRSPIRASLIIACVLAVYLSYHQLNFAITNADGGYDYIIIGRQVLSVCLAASFITYFISWSNKLSSRISEEELRYKQLIVDVDRSSWLVETIMDWQEQFDSPFPLDLLRELSRGLYGNDVNTSDDDNPANTLARAVFSSASRVKVGNAGTEVEIERNDLRKASKELNK